MKARRHLGWIAVACVVGFLAASSGWRLTWCQETPKDKEEKKAAPTEGEKAPAKSGEPAKAPATGETTKPDKTPKVLRMVEPEPTGAKPPVTVKPAETKKAVEPAKPTEIAKPVEVAKPEGTGRPEVGVSNLRFVTSEYGVKKSRFRGEHTDCCLCGLCARYCTEVTKRNAVYFKGRGIERQMAILPEMVAECTYCGKCFGLCTGGWIVNQGDNAFGS